MNIEDIEFAQENIRKPYHEEVGGKTPEQMRYLIQYLTNVKKSLEDVFDPEFRSGQLSRNLKETLKRQHKVLLTGHGDDDERASVDANLSYRGYMAGAPGTEDIPAGSMLHEETMTQFKAAKLVLRGPDVTEITLEGPFPETILINGIAERLQAQELAARHNRFFSSPQPKNTIDNAGRVIHIYPRFLANTQTIYLEQMASVMNRLENLLLEATPAFRIQSATELIAEYYHVGINAHLFERGNNSLLMSHVNYLLRFMGLKGIRHQYWDYMALINHTHDFVPMLVGAMKEVNPEVT